MNKLAGLFGCLLLVMQGFTQTVSLKDIRGNTVKLYEKPGGKARVYYFLSPECPLCQSYSLTIRNLYDEFNKQGIDMIGIIPGTDFSEEIMNEYRVKYKIPVRLLLDEQMVLVKKYRVTITPEVVVVNAKGEVMYQGRIDNWAYELGKKRKVITEHNLKDALSAVVRNKQVIVKRTKAVGCYIE